MVPTRAYSWGHSAPRQYKVSYGQHNHGTLAEIKVGGTRSPSIQFRPLSLRLRHFWSPKKGSEEQTIQLGRRRQAVTCVTDSQRNPGNFTRQPFTSLGSSGTSASTARANTSDKQVLVSVPRPPARLFSNAPHILEPKESRL